MDSITIISGSKLMAARTASNSNQANLMNALKRCQEEQADPLPTTGSPSTSVSSRASNYRAVPLSPLDQEYPEPEPQMSMMIPPKRNKHKSGKSKEQPKRENIVNVNINDVGEAAEWLEKGTKDDQDFRDTDPIAASNSLTASIREKMQHKADQIMMGTFRTVRNPTSQSLAEKARKIKENNERRVRPQNIQSSYVPQSEQSARDNITSPVRIDQRLNESRDVLTSEAALLQPFGSNQEAAPTLPPPVAREASRLVRQPVAADVDDQDSRWNKISQETLKQKKELVATKKEYTQKDIEEYYLARDVSTHKRVIELELEEHKKEDYFQFFKACIGIASKPVETTIRLQLLALSKLQICSDQDAYLLQALWSLLKGTPFNRYGQHWVDIGFQGRDPATDLRSTGVLSLLMIYMFGKRLPDYFKKVYSGSIDCILEFPFAISLVKITGTYLKLLKKGKIHASSFSQYCQWFEAICFSVFERLLKQKVGITEFGMLITQLLDQAQQKPKQLLKAYKAAHLN